MARSLIRNTLLYMPAQVLGPLVQFAVVVTWTHLLDPGTFGIVTFVVAAQELTALVGLAWWSLYMLRFRQRYEGADDTRFRAMDSRMAMYGSLTQIAFAPLCLLAIHARADATTTLATAAYLIARLLVVHYSEWARSQHRIAAYTFAQIAGPVFGSGLSVAAILMLGPTPAVALASMAIGQALGVFGLMAALGVRPQLGIFDTSIFADARSYGVPLIFSGLFAWAAINGVRILVEAGAGVVGLGLLSAGWGLGQRVTNLIAMISTAAAFPIAVDRMESGDRAGALGQVSLNGTLMLALLSPATAGAAILSAPIVNLLIAADYRSVTIFVLPVSLAVGALRLYRLHTADQAGMLLERTRVLSVSNFVDALFTLLCAAMGLKLGGIEGAALGCLVGTALAAVGALTYAVGWLELPVDVAAIGRIFLAVGAMSALLAVTPAPRTALEIAGAIMLGAIGYFAVLAALFPKVRERLGDGVAAAFAARR